MQEFLKVILIRLSECIVPKVYDLDCFIADHICMVILHGIPRNLNQHIFGELLLGFGKLLDLSLPLLF